MNMTEEYNECSSCMHRYKKDNPICKSCEQGYPSNFEEE